MDILLIIVAFLCLLFGIIGSIVPMLPGPPIAYVGLWLAQWSRFCDFSPTFLVVTGLLMVLITVIDNVLPPYITNKTGGSRYATIGSIIGMLAGIFFTAVGMLAGMLLGAFIGEWLFARRGAGSALKAALGAFVGFLLGTGMKLIYCFYLIVAIIAEC